VEEKFRKAMVQNAQLDNEKSALAYHVELLKDKIEDLEESLALLQREHRDKCRDYENLKRLSNQLKDDLQYYKHQLEERDQLIKVCNCYRQVELGFMFNIFYVIPFTLFVGVWSSHRRK